MKSYHFQTTPEFIDLPEEWDFTSGIFEESTTPPLSLNNLLDYLRQIIRRQSRQPQPPTQAHRTVSGSCWSNLQR